MEGMPGCGCQVFLQFEKDWKKDGRDGDRWGHPLYIYILSILLPITQQ